MTPSDFKKLILECSDAMWQAAASMMQSQAEAQDVIADTVEKLWRSHQRLDEVENLKGYVIIAVRRTALDAIRSANRKGAFLGIDDLPAMAPDPLLSPQQKLELEGELELVRDMMNHLPANQRRVLELTAFRGLDNSEVATATGLSVENVRVLLSRGRAKLRAAYRNFYR